MPIIMEGTRPPTGASPTQPYKCSQYFKIKVNVNTCGFAFDFEVDFNILTAFIRLGRAGPVGAGCPPYYYLIFI